MSTRTHETAIVADPDLPTIRITREFDAPPEKVFRAFTDPELFAGGSDRAASRPGSSVGTPRTGGHYRYAAVRDGEEIAAFYGSFHEVRLDERIVQTFTWEGEPDGVSLETMTFVDLGNGRTRLEAMSVVDTMEVRDAIMASGMDVGVNEGYAKLDELLAVVSDGRRATTAASPASSPIGSGGVGPAWDAPPRSPAGPPATSSATGGVVPGVPRRRLRHPAAGRTVGRRRPGRRLAGPVRRRAGGARRPASAPKMFVNPHIGEVPLAEAIDRFYTADVFMHTWDLARATGQDDTLDTEYCAELLDGHEPVSRRRCAGPGSTGRGCRCPTTRPCRTGCSASSAGTRTGAPSDEI